MSGIWADTAYRLLPTAIEKGRDLSSMSGILADTAYGLLPATRPGLHARQMARPTLPGFTSGAG